MVVNFQSASLAAVGALVRRVLVGRAFRHVAAVAAAVGRERAAAAEAEKREANAAEARRRAEHSPP